MFSFLEWRSLRSEIRVLVRFFLAHGVCYVMPSRNMDVLVHFVRLACTPRASVLPRCLPACPGSPGCQPWQPRLPAAPPQRWKGWRWRVAWHATPRSIAVLGTKGRTCRRRPSSSVQPHWWQCMLNLHLQQCGPLTTCARETGPGLSMCGRETASLTALQSANKHMQVATPKAKERGTNPSRSLLNPWFACREQGRR